jgi:hypothetical protein
MRYRLAVLLSTAGVVGGVVGRFTGAAHKRRHGGNMHPSRIIRHFAAATLLSLFATACSMDFGLSGWSGVTGPAVCGIGLFGEGPHHPCVGLALYPGTGVVLLKGETLRMSTSSDSGYAAPVTWSITGAAVTAVVGSEREEPETLGGGRSASILVKGLQLGSATVTASHANPARTASSTITVVDSSY